MGECIMEGPLKLVLQMEETNLMGECAGKFAWLMGKCVGISQLQHGHLKYKIIICSKLHCLINFPSILGPKKKQS